MYLEVDARGSGRDDRHASAVKPDKQLAIVGFLGMFCEERNRRQRDFGRGTL